MWGPGRSFVFVMSLAACNSSDTGTRPATGGAMASAGGSGGGLSTGGALASGGSVASSDAGGPAATGGVVHRDGAVVQSTGGTGGLDAPLLMDVADVGRPDRVLSSDAVTEAPVSVDAGNSLRFAVPLYIWPGEGTEWAQVAAAGGAVSYIVANAGDPGGPGASADSTYTTAIVNAHRAGQRVLGYVDTTFASRALATVSAEVDQWYSFYPQIDGIFLDQTPADAGSIANYFKPASDHIRSKPGAHVVIINPGQPDFAESYMAIADVAMAFENPYGSASDGYGPGKYSAPAWMTKYSADHFWHVILEVSEPSAMRDVLALARSRNAGHVYVTNYADPPAYARLPTYFTDEIAALAR